MKAPEENGKPPGSAEERLERRLEKAFWVAAIAISLLFVAADRHVMGNDGVAYLDQGDAFFRGDWQMAINAYWSPLYSVLLGAAIKVFRPSAYWEFSVVHLVNFLIFLAALASFAFFLRELIRHHRQRDRTLGEEWMSLPGWAWVTLGYSLFIWTSQFWITVRHVSPDLFVGVCVFLAAGLTLRIRRGETRWREFILLGLALGVGYLAKAAMFPLAFVFLLVSLLAVGDLRKAVPRVAVALFAFFLVAGPWIVAISQSKGRVTFGDSGRLNYAAHVARFPWRHWQGLPEGSGTPKHPTRQLLTDPPVYEFGSPIGGTYPNFYDPSYWYDGIRPPFELGRHLRGMLSKSQFYIDLLFGLHSSLVISFFVLVYMSGRGLRLREVLAEWILLVPALAALLMYTQVYIEPRYVGPFVLLLVAGLFSSARLRSRREDKRLIACLMIVIVAMLTLTSSRPAAEAAVNLLRDARAGREAAGGKAWKVAEGMKRLGVQPGRKVASLKYSNLGHVAWARLARVRIVAETFSDDPHGDEKAFWAADRSVRERVLRTFAKAGADVAVGCEVPAWAAGEGWRRVGDTDYHVYFLGGK